MTWTVNKDLAVEAMAAIETQPWRHEQAAWRSDFQSENRIEKFHDDPLNPSCGTAFCFAGWVVSLDRGKWVVDRFGDSVSHLVGDPDRCKCPASQPYCNCGNWMSAGLYAAKRLGMDSVDADALFASENTLDTLRIGVKAYLNDESAYDAMVAAGCYAYDEDDE